MKVGLFVCDHVSEKAQPQFGDYPDMYQRLFPECEFVLYDAINGQFPEQLGECEIYMATGSGHSVYEDLPWILRLKTIIQELYVSQIPFVGFCFGHQLIGEALGGKVAKSPRGWCVGVHVFTVTETAPWMQATQTGFNLLMMCQDQILQLPEHSRVLAGNESCPVGMIQVGDYALGIQAHPEFSKAYDQMLMEGRVDRMGHETVQAGLASLEKPVHTELIHDWVMNFLAMAKSAKTA